MANKKSRIDINEELQQANSTIKNSEFIGEAVNAVVDNQEAIVITVFRMLTTFVVGLITVITAVLNIPFKIFKSKEEF
tara:strand:+ start:1424 stop:1657 length:234 start_codon:yes stop_codon:yes gene_type:complete